MVNAGGYQHYKEQAITTMTKGEMLRLLYDEIIKRLKKAKICAEVENWAVYESELGRAKEIVFYLTNTLDRKYSVSADLARLYEFIGYQLTRALAGRNIKLIDEIIPLVADLCDTFKEADRLTKKGNMTAGG